MRTYRTDYIGHDRAYQRKRADPAYVGWSKQDGFDEDWQLRWQPLTQERTFPSHGRLLELGCGAGNVSIQFAHAGYTVTGIDIAPTAIDWAIANATQAEVDVQFILGDVLTLSDIADESFDIVFDGHCFHCIIGGDRPKFLQAAHRVLKKGGILAINSMCNDVPDNEYWHKFFDPDTRCTIHDGLATRYIGDSNDIIQEVIQAGFRILDVAISVPVDDEDLADLRVIASKEVL